MTQELWVGLIVAAAACYAVWYWLPLKLRRRLLRRPASTPMSAPGCGSCNACADGCAAAPRGAEWHVLSLSKSAATQDASSDGRP